MPYSLKVDWTCHPGCKPPRCTDRATFEAEQEAYEIAWLAQYAPDVTDPEEQAAILRYYP